ncbi:hypothetical protein CK203_106053 [Vitis vinifera]|uniref:Uncharacterized protein n=1 Tax=Vitis vinifera TaxID=29760 RepID=A0A438C5T1_VITVI|nr:hypothetical protein CK203_106053 [Vitis vinifera]
MPCSSRVRMEIPSHEYPLTFISYFLRAIVLQVEEMTYIIKRAFMRYLSAKMVEPKENFVIFLTLFVLYFFLPKFLPHFGVKLVFMLFIAINRIPSAVIHNQTPLMSTTNLSLDLDSVVSLVMAKLKRDIFDASPRQVADEQIDDELPHLEPGSPAPTLPEDPP